MIAWVKEKIRTHKPFLTAPLFIGVLAAKLASGSYFASHYLRDLFLPFVQFFVDSGGSNPWNEFLHRGVLDAFPYSSVMLALLSLPQCAGALVFGHASAIPAPLQLLLMRLPMLAADVAIYLILCRWFEAKWQWVLRLYWCSPILFYISYVHGQIDAIPTAFLFVSLYFAVQERPLAAGVSIAMGIAAKFHLAAAVPLIGFFLLKKNSGRHGWAHLAKFSAALTLGVAVLIGPLLRSEGYRVLVLQAKEAQWIYILGIPMPYGIRILVCPMALVFLILHFFSYEKILKEVLILYVGLLYTLLIVLVFPMPGWSYWSIPFLIYFLIRQNVPGYMPFWSYNLFYFLYFILFAPTVGVASSHDLAGTPSALHLTSLVFTFMQASLFLTAVWVYRVGVKAYVRYKAHHQVLSIGIGGDSASGKHTLAETIISLLGVENTVRLHGDDYHRWPRHHEAWQLQTHLDPRSNYFRQPLEHIRSLKSGTAIAHSSYDHSTGEFSEPSHVPPNRFIIFEGLHPFVFERMRESFEIKIFLATDETLRQRWKLERDSRERGHSAEKVAQEIERRAQDSERFVKPQSQFADWVLEYFPVQETQEPDKEPLPPETLMARHFISSHVVEIEDLVDQLSAVRGRDFRIAWSMEKDLRRQILEVRGHLEAAQVERIAVAMFPNLSDLIGARPQWLGGHKGINQLIFLSLISNRDAR